MWGKLSDQWHCISADVKLLLLFEPTLPDSWICLKRLENSNYLLSHAAAKRSPRAFSLQLLLHDHAWSAGQLLPYGDAWLAAADLSCNPVVEDHHVQACCSACKLFSDITRRYSSDLPVVSLDYTRPKGSSIHHHLQSYWKRPLMYHQKSLCSKCVKKLFFIFVRAKEAWNACWCLNLGAGLALLSSSRSMFPAPLPLSVS